MAAACTCTVCKKKDQMYVPVEWCTECQKALCSTCSQKHTRDHDTLSYSDYVQLPPIIKNLNHTCPDHKKTFLHLCREHDQLICNKCLKTEHKKCKETPALKDIVRNVKTSHAFDDVTSEMEENSKILQNGIRELQHNLNEFQIQREEMARNIEETMDRLMTELNKIKNNMLSEINVVIQKHEEDIGRTILKLQTMEKELTKIINQKQSITLHATNLQTYFGIKDMEKVVQETTKNLTELSYKGALDQINIRLDQTKSKTVDMLFNDITLFGEINVIKRAAKLSLETSKPQEAQNKTYTLPKQLQLQKKVDLRSGYHTGCCTLRSGMAVVTDHDNKRLKLINPNGTLKPTVRIEDFSYDVTTVDVHHIAVSYGKTISMVDIKRKKVMNSWDIENVVRGISYKDGHIFFCIPQSGIKRLHKDTGAIDNVINDKDVNYDSCIGTSSDRICYTCPVIHTVTVLNLQHDIIFKYEDRDRLESPLGVTIDSNNNVYVSGYTSNNVIAISPDGQMVHQLLSKEDELSNPTGMNYDSHTEQLIVITRANDSATLCKYSLLTD